MTTQAVPTATTSNRKSTWLYLLACIAIVNSAAVFTVFSSSALSEKDATDVHKKDAVPARLRAFQDNGEKIKRALQENNHQTGAFADCQEHIVTTGSPHPDQKDITLSCHTFPYRMPTIDAAEEIFIGVLSGAGGIGLRRRMSIRDTWARGHSVFFIVAGPWEDIKSEYEHFQDLIWLDQEEIYDGEKSVLTFKTMTFMTIAHDLSSKQNLDIKYAFKTDDDSFVNVKYLHEYLLHTEREKELDYWGKCSDIYFKPSRDPNNKWSVSNEMYPEEFYPKYCQGAGFALSTTFLDCAAGPEEHLARMRFMPFEDAAVGLLAERCGIEPMSANDLLINQFRTPLKEEHLRVKLSLPKIDKTKLTIPTMEQRIVQHRIYDEWDMNEHFKQVANPSLYKELTSIKWYIPKHDEIYRWDEDTDYNPNAKASVRRNHKS